MTTHGLRRTRGNRTELVGRSEVHVDYDTDVRQETMLARNNRR